MLSSCKTDEKANLVYSDETETHRIEISTIDTKINENGKAQCSKHVSSIRNDSIYKYYGLDLPTQLAYSLETSKKYLTGNYLESLGTKYLKIRIENFSEEPLNYDSIIHLSLTRCFNITITPTSKEINGYRLNIFDANKLNERSVQCGSGLVEYNNGVFSATSIKFSVISKIIDENNEEYFDFNTDNGRCYKVQFITNHDVNKINDKIEAYGLRYDKVNYLQVFYNIELNSYH